MSVGGTPLPFLVSRDVLKGDPFRVPSFGPNVVDLSTTTLIAGPVTFPSFLVPSGNGTLSIFPSVSATTNGGADYAGWLYGFASFVTLGVPSPSGGPFPPNQGNSAALAGATIDFIPNGGAYDLVLASGLAQPVGWTLILSYAEVNL